MQQHEYINLQHGDKIVPLCIYDKDEYISNHIRICKSFYESWILEYIEKNYHKNKNIIDVGANFGNHVKFFANFLEYDFIYAFEPQQENYELLKNNTQTNCISWNCALGASTCKCNLNVPDEENCGLYKIAEINSASSYIDMYAIDDFKFSYITLMKIDVEGYEYQVILGAIRTIIKWKPVLFVETNDVRVHEILSLLGYTTGRKFYENNARSGPVPTFEFIYREVEA